MKTPELSIVVPIYDVQPYLARCLDSIQHQSFFDWECILVDDGSPDDCGAICAEYASRDQRFCVFHKANGGVSTARNLGLQHCSAEWVLFVDPDDELPSDALQAYLSIVGQGDYDMVMGNYERVENSQVSMSDTFAGMRVMDTNEVLSLFFHAPNDYFQGFLWNRLLRRDIIVEHNLHFNEQIYYKEDGLFLVQYLLSCRHLLAFTPQIVYRYYLRDASAMGRAMLAFNPRYLTNLDARILIYRELRNRCDDASIIESARRTIGEGTSFTLSRIRRDKKHFVYILPLIWRLLRNGQFFYASKEVVHRRIHRG